MYCSNLLNLNCESLITGYPMSQGHDYVDAYTCLPGWPMDGYEVTYQFVPDMDGFHTIHLDVENGFMLPIILEACNEFESTCFMEPFQVSWNATAGVTYWVVVDGPSTMQDPSTLFHLEVECPDEQEAVPTLSTHGLLILLIAISVLALASVRKRRVLQEH
jgi:hypothetical protein